LKAILPAWRGLRATMLNSSYSSGARLPRLHTTPTMRWLLSRSTSLSHPAFGMKRETTRSGGNSTRRLVVATFFSVGTRKV
jgi:hypothetical protein